jgi:hypothetical protein
MNPRQETWKNRALHLNVESPCDVIKNVGSRESQGVYISRKLLMFLFREIDLLGGSGYVANFPTEDFAKG